MLYQGIDIGSSSCCVVIINGKKEIVSSSVVPTGARNFEALKRATREVFENAGISEKDIGHTVSTGYGRERVENRDKDISEIACHAKGISNYFPDTNLLIDIGGQDSKAIRIQPGGKVVDFSMNDKCAAGTGRFLEAMARVLEVDIDQFETLDAGAEGSQSISNMCTVFAESEIVSLVAQGIEIKEITNAINRSIATRTFSMTKRMTIGVHNLSVAMSGGVARNGGVVRMLERLLKKKIAIPPEPDRIGAFGAALFAME